VLCDPARPRIPRSRSIARSLWPTPRHRPAARAGRNRRRGAPAGSPRRWRSRPPAGRRPMNSNSAFDMPSAYDGSTAISSAARKPGHVPRPCLNQRHLRAESQFRNQSFQLRPLFALAGDEEPAPVVARLRRGPAARINTSIPFTGRRFASVPMVIPPTRAGGRNGGETIEIDPRFRERSASAGSRPRSSAAPPGQARSWSRWRERAGRRTGPGGGARA